MYRTIFLLLFIASACTLPEKKKENQLPQKSDTTSLATNDTNAATIDTSAAIILPIVQKIKSPSGIYGATIPLNSTIEQIVAFNPDLTYQLQEKYFNGERDSIVITEGTWVPSDGFIWLYKDQITRGRYKWKGDTLQYCSALLKRNFSMRHLKDAMQNGDWREKSKQGIVAFGAGTEPFWNIEIDNKDSVSFLLSEWDHPLKMKMQSSFKTNDSTSYIAHNDAVHMSVTIFPYFCNDGMSDLTYRNKVRVHYNQQIYNGCGILYK